jgi:hypothetical protein
MKKPTTPFVTDRLSREGHSPTSGTIRENRGTWYTTVRCTCGAIISGQGVRLMLSGRIEWRNHLPRGPQTGTVSVELRRLDAGEEYKKGGAFTNNWYSRLQEAMRNHYGQAIH